MVKKLQIPSLPRTGKQLIKDGEVQNETPRILGRKITGKYQE